MSTKTTPITPRDQIRMTIGLLNSMINGGEDHSEQSEQMVDQAFKNLEKAVFPLDGDSLSDDEIKAWWSSSGGDFHGPKIEHASIREDQFLPLMRKLLMEARIGRLLMTGK